MNKKVEWTEEKIKFLIEHYPTGTAHEIADFVGCSDCTVNVKAKELGVVKAPTFRKSDFHGRYVKKGKLK